MDTDCIVYVVDDDPSVRKSLCWLLESVSYRTQSFNSAQGFLSSYDASVPGCLLLDVRMPGADGLELQAMLDNQEIDVPIIFISGHVDVRLASAAFRAGACDVLTKPVDVNLLLERVEEALEKDRKRQLTQSENKAKHLQLRRLTPQERDVLLELLKGRTIEQLATHFQIPQQTAEKRRSRVLEKLCVETDAQLIHTFQDVVDT